MNIFNLFIPKASFGNQLPNYGVTPSRSMPGYDLHGSPNIATPPNMKPFSSLQRTDLYNPFIGPSPALTGAPNRADQAAVKTRQYIPGLFSVPHTGMS